MNPLSTPGLLEQRAEFFHQLAALLGAGIGLIDALHHLRTHSASPRWRRMIDRMAASLKSGSTFTEALRDSDFSSFDQALISAGEQSGRLDACLSLLDRAYAERAQLVRVVLAQLYYPGFIVILALLIFPISSLIGLVKGNVDGFVFQKIAIFGGIAGVIVLAMYACQSARGENWRALLEKIIQRVPLLGSAVRHFALARLTAALEALIQAGVSIIESWQIAAAASGSPAIRRKIAAAKIRMLGGETPAEVIGTLRVFPSQFVGLYQTGEISGKLDETLRRMYAYHQDEASRKFKSVAELSPRILYVVVLIAVGLQVISFWSGYFKQMGNFF